jgi:hypothetical protein
MIPQFIYLLTLFFYPGEGSAYIESLITRDNRRFDAICEQIQRKAERLHLSKQPSMEVHLCTLSQEFTQASHFPSLRNDEHATAL